MNYTTDAYTAAHGSKTIIILLSYLYRSLIELLIRLALVQLM